MNSNKVYDNFRDYDFISNTYKGIDRNKIKWYPTIDKSKCNNCKTCLQICPMKVYEINDNKEVIVAYPYRCIVSCSYCAVRCQNVAISFPDEDELKEIIKKFKG
ncbi:MAG: 4Fe-4S binding protein [Actinobacteria bacterium]|nr:4Fe-4S binding protein [Actinomycetota bacterium]